MQHPWKRLIASLSLLLLAACGSTPAALPTPDRTVVAAQGAAAPTAANASTSAVPDATPAATNASDDASTLRVGTPFLNEPFDPVAGGGFNAIQFGGGETLIRLDPTFAAVPWLANSSPPTATPCRRSRYARA